jgi:anti-anti-sigma factor
MALHESAPQDEQPRADAARIDLSALADDAILVTLTGEHDLATTERLLEALADAREHPNLIIDLTPCTFVDSSVIRVLARACDADAPGTQRVAIALPNAGGIVDRAFALLSLREVITLYQTVEEALKGLGDAAANGRASRGSAA